MAIVDRIASTRLPAVQFFSFMLSMSVATQKKGTGSLSKATESW